MHIWQPHILRGFAVLTSFRRYNHMTSTDLAKTFHNVFFDLAKTQHNNISQTKWRLEGCSYGAYTHPFLAARARIRGIECLHRNFAMNFTRQLTVMHLHSLMYLTLTQAVKCKKYWRKRDLYEVFYTTYHFYSYLPIFNCHFNTWKWYYILYDLSLVIPFKTSAVSSDLAACSIILRV